MVTNKHNKYIEQVDTMMDEKETPKSVASDKKEVSIRYMMLMNIIQGSSNTIAALRTVLAILDRNTSVYELIQEYVETDLLQKGRDSVKDREVPYRKLQKDTEAVKRSLMCVISNEQFNHANIKKFYEEIISALFEKATLSPLPTYAIRAHKIRTNNAIPSKIYNCLTPIQLTKLQGFWSKEVLLLSVRQEEECHVSKREKKIQNTISIGLLLIGVYFSFSNRSWEPVSSTLFAVGVLQLWKVIFNCFFCSKRCTDILLDEQYRFIEQAQRDWFLPGWLRPEEPPNKSRANPLRSPYSVPSPPPSLRAALETVSLEETQTIQSSPERSLLRGSPGLDKRGKAAVSAVAAPPASRNTEGEGRSVLVNADGKAWAIHDPAQPSATNLFKARGARVGGGVQFVALDPRLKMQLSDLDWCNLQQLAEKARFGIDIVRMRGRKISDPETGEEKVCYELKTATATRYLGVSITVGDMQVLLFTTQTGKESGKNDRTEMQGFHENVLPRLRWQPSFYGGGGRVIPRASKEDEPSTLSALNRRMRA